MRKIPAIQAVLISINTSYKTTLDVETFRRILRGLEPVGNWCGHIGCFFSDVPASDILRLVQEERVTLYGIARLFFNQNKIYQIQKFKNFLIENGIPV